MVFPRGAYKLTRDRVEEMHPGTSFRDFFQGTVSVTDYNMLGAVMYHLHRDNMKWMEVTGEDHAFPVLRHVSWSGLTIEEAARMECILHADVAWMTPGGDGVPPPGWSAGSGWNPPPLKDCPPLDLCALGEYRGKHRRTCEERKVDGDP